MKHLGFVDIGHIVIIDGKEYQAAPPTLSRSCIGCATKLSEPLCYKMPGCFNSGKGVFNREGVIDIIWKDVSEVAF